MRDFINEFHNVLQARFVDFVVGVHHADLVFVHILLGCSGVMGFLAGESLFEVHDTIDAFVAVHQDGRL